VTHSCFRNRVEYAANCLRNGYGLTGDRFRDCINDPEEGEYLIVWLMGKIPYAPKLSRGMRAHLGEKGWVKWNEILVKHGGSPIPW